MHGDGMLVDTQSGEEVKVSYVNGRCITDDLPPQIQKTLQQIKDKKQKKSDTKNMEEIQEEIEGNPADQDEDNYDMQEDDEEV